MAYVAIAVVLGGLIAIHELGHLLAAKLCGIPVRRFSIGFGPPLVSIRRGETEYRLSLIPLGGYVLPALDEGQLEDLPLHKSVTFALGGPVANLVLTYLGLALFAFLRPGASLLAAISLALTELVAQVRLTAQAFATLLTGQADVMGVVGIVALGGSRFGSTFSGLVTFAIVLSLNLAVFNLLPVPPLDGGRIVFSSLAKLCRPVRRAQAAVTLAGWILMLAVMAYATYRDLGRIAAGLVS
jgi:regulator of sigma E protease